MVGGGHGWWGRPLLPEIFGQPAPGRWSEIADFRSIFARSTSAVTPSDKKLKLTLTGSPLTHHAVRPLCDSWATCTGYRWNTCHEAVESYR